MSEQPKDHSELIQKILTGTRWATVLRSAGQIVSWVCTIIVVRYVTPADYGLNAMLESPLVILMLLSTLGLDSVLVQKKQLADHELQGIFGWLLVINLLLFVTLFFGGSLLANYYHEPNIESLAKAASLMFLLVPFRVIPNALLDRDLNFRLKAQVELSAAIISALSALLLAYFSFGVWALVLGTLMSRLISALALMILKPWFIWPTLNISAVKQAISFGGVITLSGLIYILSEMIITLLAGPKLGAQNLGLYAVSWQLALLPLSKGMPIINQTMLPAFSRFQDDPKVASYYLGRLLGVASIIFIPAMIGLCAVAKPFVIVLFGDKWVGSVLLLQIFSIALILRFCISLIKSVTISMGRVDLSFKINLIQFMTMALGVSLSMGYGIVTLALVWTLSEIIAMISTIYYSKKVVPIGYQYLISHLIPALASSILMFITIKLVYLSAENIIENGTLLFLQILIGAGVYIGTLRIFFNDQLTIAGKVIFGRNFDQKYSLNRY